jgi:hypothetical protein
MSNRKIEVEPNWMANVSPELIRQTLGNNPNPLVLESIRQMGILQLLRAKYDGEPLPVIVSQNETQKKQKKKESQDKKELWEYSQNTHHRRRRRRRR